VSQFSSGHSRFDPSLSQTEKIQVARSMRSHKAAECRGCSTERIFMVQTVNFVEPGFSLMSSERRSIDKKGSRQREVAYVCQLQRHVE